MTPLPELRLEEITSEDFPAIFRHADDSAVVHQKRFRRLVITFSATASLTALAGLMNQSPIQMAIVFSFTVLQLLATLINSAFGWNHRWYQSRAIAESVKSLTWRYAVGGLPFPLSMNAADATESLSKAILSILRTSLNNSPLIASKLPQNEDMSKIDNLRSSDLKTRSDAYIKFRLQEQEHWYARKAVTLRKNRNLLNGIAISSSVFAAIGSVVLIVNPELFDTSFITFLASVAVGLISIGQSRNLGTDISAYQLTHYEIKKILGIQPPQEDGAWSYWVDDKEEVLSREHVMWLASRSSVAVIPKDER
jgi:hypothetical protein